MGQTIMGYVFLRRGRLWPTKVHAGYMLVILTCVFSSCLDSEKITAWHAVLICLAVKIGFLSEGSRTVFSFFSLRSTALTCHACHQ